MKKKYNRYGLLNVDIESIVRKHDLVYENAATCWQHGHILGNGDIGAVCYAPYWLEWTINKIDVFDSRMAPFKKLTYKKVMNEVKKRKVSNLLFLNELEKPDKNYNGPIEPLLKSCGQIKIRTSGNEYTWAASPPYKIRQVLSLLEAKDYMEMNLPDSHPKVWSFVSRENNLLVIRMKEATEPMWSKRVELCRPYDGDYKPTIFGFDNKKNLIWFTQKIPDGSSYTIVIGVKTLPSVFRYYDPLITKTNNTEYSKIESIKQKGDRIWFNVNGDMDIFVGIATSYEDKNHLSLAKKIVLDSMKKGYEKLESEHKRWWANFWKKSFIQVDDPIHEQLWYFGLYQAGSSLKRAPVPGLHGLWYGYQDLPVQGFFWAMYTMDQNVQIPVMPVFAVNHPELALPFMDTFLNALPKTIEETKKQFNLQGACYPLEMVFLGGEPYYGSAYRLTVCGGPYCGIIFTWVYKYTQDKELLRTKVYPYLREVVRFFTSFMEKGKDGPYHLPLTVPAEIFTLSRDAIETISLLKPCLIMAIEASKLLNTDIEEREKWEDVLKNYPSYPTKKGILVNGIDVEKLDYPYNEQIIFRLYPIFPGNDNTVKYLIRKTLKFIKKVLVDNCKAPACQGFLRLGWSWFFYTMAHLRLGNKDTVNKLLNKGIDSFFKPNGLSVHLHAGKGVTENPRVKELLNSTPENNAAFLMITTEALLQSYDGVIRVFHGIRKNQNARFGNLRAEGAFLISSEMIKGKVSFVSIYSEKGGTARLQNPWSKETIKLIRKNGKYKKIKGEIIPIDLKKNEIVILRP